MKHKWLAALASLALGVALMTPDVEAKRMGGGNSVGQQSGMAKRAPAQQPPQQAAQGAANPGAAAAAKPAGNRWLGPIAGLAAGLGLAALASHLGLGEAFGSILMMVLLGVGLLVAFKMFMARRQAGNLAMGGAGANGAAGPKHAQTGNFRSGLGAGTAAAGASAAGAAGGAVASAASTAVANFDTDQFVRSARSQFLRLQAAFDKREIADLREFTSPAMYAELERELAQRGDAEQVTDVVTLNANFIGTEAFGASGLSEVAAVRFSGMIRETANGEPEAFDEVWNFSRPVDRSAGWVLAGIEQVEA